MLHYLSNPELFNKPVLLAKDTLPLEVIKSVFQDYHLLEQRTMLWKLVHVALTTENGEFEDAQERSGLLYQCGKLEELLEAAWMANEAHKLAAQDDKVG